MDTYNTLSKLYERWGDANGISPLPSADDLKFDALHGRRSLSNIQIKWLDRFCNTWWKAENHEYEKSKSEEDKIMEIWNEYLVNDKRSFNEYFSEEHGFECNEDITYKQIKFLCEKLIGGKVYYV